MYLYKLIAQGEHETLEFKHEINDPRKIVAFANTKGGRLLVVSNIIETSASDSLTSVNDSLTSANDSLTSVLVKNYSLTLVVSIAAIKMTNSGAVFKLKQM